MTTYTTTGTAITENGSGAAISVSTVSFALVVADGATPRQTYTIATTSNGWVPVIDVSFPNAVDLSVDGTSTNQSSFLVGPSDFAFLGDITWNDGGSLQVTTVFGYWDDDSNTRYVFTMGGDALPSFADASAYNSWLTNDVTLFSQAGTPYGPGDSIDLSTVGGFSSTEDDTVNGTDFNDVLFGGTGNDTLLGNDGFDVLQGGNGADILNGGADFDIANYLFEGGTSGVTASLLTNLATDSYGNTDTLVSIEGFYGTHSADTFHGDGGINLFEGNGGADRFYGYGGYDIVDYSNEIGGTGIELLNNFFTSIFSAYDTFGNLDTGASIEAIYATQYDDILRGQDHDTYYYGLGGDDQIYAYTGDDTLFGGDGFDILGGGAGNDIIDGGGTGAEDELYYGNFLADSVTVDMVNGVAISSSGDVDQFFNIFRIFGSARADHFIGNSDNNEFVGGGGYDTIDGGGGVDRVRYDLETSLRNVGINADLTTGEVWASYAGIDTLLNIEWIVGSLLDDTMLGNADSNTLEGHLGDDVMDGGAGIDTLSFFFAGFRINMDLAVTTQQYTIGAGFDTISNFENILGSSYNDTFFGDGADNVIQGGAGADTIDGRGDGANGDTASYEQSSARVIVDLLTGTGAEGDAAGDTLMNIENLTGSDHNDQLTGSGIGNILSGGAGNDNIQGLAGNDVLRGGNGHDTLRGGDGKDSIRGGNGADKIYGDNHVDRLYGQAGDDRMYGDGGADRMYGGDGDDKMHGGVGADRMYGDDDADQMYGDNGSDIMHGGQGTDRMYGNAANDRMYGDGGADRMYGGSGDDRVYGGSGNDRMYGAVGNDTISGGVGNDIMEGGGDSDTFVFRKNHGIDTITDFATSIDTIEFSGTGLNFTALSISYAGGDATIDYGTGTITLEGVASGLTASDFDFL